LGKMEKMGLRPGLLVDCSHANSNKQALAQGQVWDEILAFHLDQDRRIFGGMLESFMETGRQDIVPGQPLKPGLSITDPCMGWTETEQLIRQAADKIRAAG
jgi:3-deoxy-7-phosphoheptulonate synthase